MTAPFVADDGYVSSASLMAPRKVVDAVGYLDTRLAYHVDADYCKRIADAGYQCWYLPTATMIHLNHKGGTTASTLVRFRSLLMFEVHSYIYYRKHIQRLARSPMQILVPLGLFAHFLILVAAQACAEVVGVIRSLSQPRKSSAP
jgi:Predicted glycosyltransferases